MKMTLRRIGHSSLIIDFSEGDTFREVLDGVIGRGANGATWPQGIWEIWDASSGNYSPNAKKVTEGTQDDMREWLDSKATEGTFMVLPLINLPSQLKAML